MTKMDVSIIFFIRVTTNFFCDIQSQNEQPNI